MSDAPVLATEEVTAPFSLYIDLEPGTKADLEAISLASISLVAAAREIAFLFDPYLGLRVELVDGTEGSLWLNTRFKALGIRTQTQKLCAGLVACGLAGFFGATVGQDLWHTYIYNPPSGPAFAQAEVETAIAKLEEHINRGAAQKQIHGVYRSLRKDRKIKGVGVAPHHKQKPRVIIPRSEFGARSSASKTQVPADKRSDKQRVLLTLVSPVLLEKDRTWAFRFAGKEIRMHMQDEKYLAELAAGKLQIRLETDIRMDVLLETKEALVNGVWTVTERNVVHVYDTIPPRSKDQGSLFTDGSDEANTDHYP